MFTSKRDCGCGYGSHMTPMPQFNPSGFGGMYDPGCGCPMDPIYETPIEKCIQKEICHEVQHICPINTKIINNHIFRHTYVPQYSCCEEDVVTNLDEGSCCKFQ